MSWLFCKKSTKKNNLLTIDYCVKKGFELHETFSYGNLDYSILKKPIKIGNNKYVLQLFKKADTKQFSFGNGFGVAVRDSLWGLTLQGISTEKELHEVYEFLTKEQL